MKLTSYLKGNFKTVKWSKSRVTQNAKSFEPQNLRFLGSFNYLSKFLHIFKDIEYDIWKNHRNW